LGFGLEIVIVAELQPSIPNGLVAGNVLEEVVDEIVAASELKLFASKNTPESNTWSDTSAIANFMWYVEHGVTAATAVSACVIPLYTTFTTKF
jgi:hypothetical protein